MGLAASIAVGAFAPAEPDPKPIPKCPPLGYTLSTGQVVVAEEDFDGNATYPLGRPFVVVKCRR